jgi:hypothetical protein
MTLVRKPRNPETQGVDAFSAELSGSRLKLFEDLDLLPHLREPLRTALGAERGHPSPAPGLLTSGPAATVRRAAGHSVNNRLMSPAAVTRMRLR